MTHKRPDAWMLIITGCGFVASYLLSFTPFAGQIEFRFQNQLIELSPALNLPAANSLVALPYGLQDIILGAVFLGLLLYLYFIRPDGPRMVFIILVVFSLFMAQLLIAVIFKMWFPAIWTMLGFSLTALALLLHSKIKTMQQNKPFSRQQQLDAIRQKVDAGELDIAVLMLKKCVFCDDIAELAYDLGIKLEQQENWILARYLYQWMAKFDPGIEDFVSSMNIKINPALEHDSATPEITQNKGQFDHYQLLGKKAAGATATVYEAEDIKTHKHIALKILTQKSLDDQGTLNFLHESVVMQKLDHPNIVKIHDANFKDEQAYIAMDYINGYPMSERLRRKRYLTAAESLRIMKSVLEALEYAHSKGVVHGDIKPANIMFDTHRKIYIVTDFGAAGNNSKAMDGEKKITGTPAYMSPEQLSGARMDGRSDLFSLAVTIYHLLSGVQPFSAEKLSELKNNVLTREVDIEVLSVPDIIKQVLQKALQKKTYQRFADASQMLQSVKYCEQKLKEK
jgi:serine/threonine-protein kinase